MQNKEIALRAAKEAGKIIIGNYKKISSITKKSRNNFATNVDIAAEKAIIGIIQKHTDHSILSEETGYIKGNPLYKWIIDPIDGTHNYIHGLPIFGVSIALEYNREVVLGVITLPMLNQIFIAEKGKGAYLNGKRIHVSNTARLDKSLVFMGGAFYKKRELKMKMIRLLSKNVPEIRLSGCAVFELTSLAAGNADIYLLFQTNPWDIAAGFLMITEAGGKITNFDGSKVDHYTRSFVASNGRLNKEFLSLIRNVN